MGVVGQLVVAKNLNKPGILVKLIQRKGNKGAKVEAEIDYTFDLLDEDKGGELDVGKRSNHEAKPTCRMISKHLSHDFETSVA